VTDNGRKILPRRLRRATSAATVRRKPWPVNDNVDLERTQGKGSLDLGPRGESRLLRPKGGDDE
jgi:hypothetical protein